MYSQAEQALDQQTGQRTPAGGQHTSPPVRTAAGNSCHNGNGHPNGGGMSASQRRAILAIARRINVDPEYEAKEIVGDALDGLSLKQASELIDHLKSLQPAGNGRTR